MAKVPQYGGPQVRDQALEGGFQRAPDVSSGLMAAGRALGQAGEVFDRADLLRAQSTADTVDTQITTEWMKWDAENRNKFRGQNVDAYEPAAQEWWKKAAETYGANLDPRAKSLVGKAQAITITSDNTTVANLEALVEVCNQNQIALFAGDIDSVARGAVMAYGLDYFLVGYSAGRKAALVLKGIKPGDVPWGPVEKFSLVMNTRAARAQGVSIPPELLARADQVIG